MQESELIERNLELSFEFMRYLLTHPEMERKIPKNAQVVLLPRLRPEAEALQSKKC